MNLHKLVRHTRYGADTPLFTGRVARKYRHPRPEPPAEVYYRDYIAAFNAVWPLEIDDVFPANQTAHVEIPD